MSENHLDVTEAAETASSIDRARYWFEQYRYASNWEARLIQAIQELTADHADPFQAAMFPAGAPSAVDR